MTDVRDGVLDVIREVLDNPTLEVRDDQRAHEVDGWDSLTHVSVLFSLEDRFGIRFSDREMGSLQNVGDLVALVGAKVHG